MKLGASRYAGTLALLLLPLVQAGCTARQTPKPGRRFTVGRAVPLVGLPIVEGSSVRALDAVEGADQRANVVALLEFPSPYGRSSSLWLWREGVGKGPAEVTQLGSEDISDPQVFLTDQGPRVTYHDQNAIHVLSESMDHAWHDAIVHEVKSPLAIRAAAVAFGKQGRMSVALALGNVQDWYGNPLEADGPGLWLLKLEPGKSARSQPVLLRRDVYAEQPQPSIVVRGDSTFIWTAIHRRSNLFVPGDGAHLQTWDQPVFGRGVDMLRIVGTDSVAFDSHGSPLNIESHVPIPNSTGFSMLAFGPELMRVSTSGERLRSIKVRTDFDRTGLLGRGRGVDFVASEGGNVVIWVDHSEEMYDVLGQMFDLANGGGWTYNQVHVGALDDTPDGTPSLEDVQTTTGSHFNCSCVRAVPARGGSLLLWGGFNAANRNPGASHSASQVWLARQSWSEQ